MEKYPVRLKKDPIVETLVEIRFTPRGDIPTSDLLPGILYSHLSGDYPKLEKTPTSEIPLAIRKTQPDLMYKPLKRLVGGQYIISIGDQVLSIACKRPYVGWKEFCQRVFKVIRLSKETSLIQKLDRVSTKYINLIPVEEGQSRLGCLKASFRMGDYDIADHNCSLRAEIIENNVVNIIQIISHAIVEYPESKEQQSGMLLDVDSIYEFKEDENWDDFELIVEHVRQAEKKVFFTLLSKEALDSFEPVWE